ncbi:hypothetical protein AC1031_021902 [Aphanomyces cochlioides]|nr:hypothetical protein AC1031_021902 [Aphanomyces cochlioides]
MRRLAISASIQSVVWKETTWSSLHLMLVKRLSIDVASTSGTIRTTPTHAMVQASRDIFSVWLASDHSPDDGLLLWDIKNWWHADGARKLDRLLLYAVVIIYPLCFLVGFRLMDVTLGVMAAIMNWGIKSPTPLRICTLVKTTKT